MQTTSLRQASFDRLWLEINDQDLFKGLRVCNLRNTPRQYPECFEEERKAKSFYSNKHILEKNPGLVRDDDPPGSWWSG